MVALKSTEPIQRISSAKHSPLVPRPRIASLQATPGHPQILPKTKQPRRLQTQTLEGQVLPGDRESTTWLRSLVKLERTVGVLTMLLGAATLTIYSLSVYSQQQWSMVYNHLQTLERNERELSVASEMLKNKIAERAFYPDTHLIPQNPTNTIFLDPTIQSYPPASVKMREPVTDALTMPLGY